MVELCTYGPGVAWGNRRIVWDANCWQNFHSGDEKYEQSTPGTTSGERYVEILVLWEPGQDRVHEIQIK